MTLDELQNRTWSGDLLQLVSNVAKVTWPQCQHISRLGIVCCPEVQRHMVRWNKAHILLFTSHVAFNIQSCRSDLGCAALEDALLDEAWQVKLGSCKRGELIDIMPRIQKDWKSEIFSERPGANLYRFYIFNTILYSQSYIYIIHRPQVRWNAAKALAFCGSEQQVSSLASCLRDEVWLVRLEACVARLIFSDPTKDAAEGFFPWVLHGCIA